MGVVYSTNPYFKPEDSPNDSVVTLSPSNQKLIVSIDRRNRSGKQVTIVKGFVGTEEDLSSLSRTLKTKCGVGGGVKEGEILIQGDFREKIVVLLNSLGYVAKRGN